MGWGPLPVTCWGWEGGRGRRRCRRNGVIGDMEVTAAEKRSCKVTAASCRRCWEKDREGLVSKSQSDSETRSAVLAARLPQVWERKLIVVEHL